MASNNRAMADHSPKGPRKEDWINFTKIKGFYSLMIAISLKAIRLMILGTMIRYRRLERGRINWHSTKMLFLLIRLKAVLEMERQNLEFGNIVTEI